MDTTLCLLAAASAQVFVRGWLIALDPVLPYVWTSIVGVIGLAVRQYVKNQDIAKALLLLAKQAQDAVAEVYQIYVKEAKDTSKPDTVWNADAARAAKAMAVERLKALAPSSLAVLKAAGHDPDTTVEQKIEAAVLALNIELTKLGPPAPPATGVAMSTVTTPTAKARRKRKATGAPAAQQ